MWIRAAAGSLIINAAIVAVLLAIAPRVFDPPRDPPVLVDVSSVAPKPPDPPPPVIAAPVATVAPVATPRRARAAPLPPSIEPGELATGLDGAGSGGSDAGTGSGAGSGTGSTQLAATKPIPIGAHDAQLPYTREALVAHTQGVVLVGVMVGVDGKVHDTTLVRGLGHGLDAIALALAAKLQFQPARDALGVPTAARITWRFHFTPPRDAL